MPNWKGVAEKMGRDAAIKSAASLFEMVTAILDIDLDHEDAITQYETPCPKCQTYNNIRVERCLDVMDIRIICDNCRNDMVISAVNPTIIIMQEVLRGIRNFDFDSIIAGYRISSKNG